MSTRFAIVQRNQSEDQRTLNEEQLPIPTPEKSQVLVKIEVAALNPTDGLYHYHSRLPRSLMHSQSNRSMVMPSGTVQSLGVTLLVL